MSHSPSLAHIQIHYHDLSQNRNYAEKQNSIQKCELVSQKLMQIECAYIESTVTAFGVKRPCI
jgi:hypothetical protein